MPFARSRPTGTTDRLSSRGRTRACIHHEFTPWHPTDNPSSTGDETFEAAAAVFNEKQLTDLTIAIGVMNAYNRMAISFRTTPLSVAKHSG